MMTTLNATFDGKVLIPQGQVDLPKGAVLRLHIEMPEERSGTVGSLAELPACGMWADRTDLADTVAAARRLRRSVELREDHAR